MNTKSLILMTTYNGEKFLVKQLDSIVNQTYKNWKLIIRDDGSTDETVSIIEKYISKDNRITLLKNDIKKHGAYLNFWTLIHHARSLPTFDYYFFSDQDDIWYEDKLERMINYDLSVGKSDIPRLVYADMEIIDGNDDTRYQSMNKEWKIGSLPKYSVFFTHTQYWGCDCMMNRVLFLNIPLINLDNKYINIISHDNYFAKYSILEGEVIFYPHVCIKHRRHEANETGNYKIRRSFCDSVIYSIRDLDKISENHGRCYTHTMVFLDIMKKNNFWDNRMGKISNAIRKGGLSGVYTMLTFHVRKSNLLKTIYLYIIMFTKKYKKYMFLEHY